MRKNGITQQDAVAIGLSQLCGYPQFNEQLEKDKPTKKSVKMQPETEIENEETTLKKPKEECFKEQCGQKC